MYYLLMSLYLFYTFVIIYRQKIDFFTLAYAGFTFYYIIAIILGYTISLNRYGVFDFSENLLPLNIYFSLSLCIFMIFQLFILTINDKFLLKSKFVYKITNPHYLRYGVKISFVLCFCLILIIFYKLNFNFDLRKIEKNLIAGFEITFLSYFYSALASFSFLILYEKVKNNRFYIYFIFLFYFCIFFFLLSQRMAALSFFLVVAIFLAFNKSRLSFKNYIHLILIFTLLIILVLWGGHGSLFDLSARLSNLNIESIMSLLEGYYISSVANYLFTYNLDLNPSYLFTAPLFIFPFIRNLLVDYNSSIFHELYKKDFFDLATHGMAYNPLIESYSTLGILGVILFSLIISILVLSFNLLYAKTTSIVRLFLISFGLLLFFFLHRASLHFYMVILFNISSIYIVIYFSYKILKKG